MYVLLKIWNCIDKCGWYLVYMSHLDSNVWDICSGVFFTDCVKIYMNYVKQSPNTNICLHRKNQICSCQRERSLINFMPWVSSYIFLFMFSFNSWIVGQKKQLWPWMILLCPECMLLISHESATDILNAMAIVIISMGVCISMIVRSIEDISGWAIVCDSANEQFCYNKYIEGRMVF